MNSVPSSWGGRFPHPGTPSLLLPSLLTFSLAHYVPSSPPSGSLAGARPGCCFRGRRRRSVWLFRAPYLWGDRRRMIFVPHVRGPLWDFYLTVCKIERDMNDEGVYHTPSCNIQIIKAPNIGGGERRGDRKTVFVLELTSNCPLSA